MIYVYAINTIDFGEKILTSVSEFRNQLINQEDPDIIIRPPHSCILLETMRRDRGGKKLHVMFFEFCLACAHAADHCEWDGDFGGFEPGVFVVPGENSFYWGIAWKQCNNGTTFVCCEIELPHLDEIAFKKYRTRWIGC